MKHNYLLLSYHNTLRKYKKYYSRLQRHVSKGSFAFLSAARKNFLVNKVEELRTKLVAMQPRLVATVAATGLLLAINMTQAEAQVQFQANPTKNPFKAVQTGATRSIPMTVDLDDDGDQDLVISSGQNLNYYENTGTNSNPSYTLQSGTANPFNGLAPTWNTAGSFADIDGDGDLDMVAGGEWYSSNNKMYYFQNTGSASSPAFTLATGTNNPFPSCPNYIGYGGASVVDIDADGDLDVFLTDGYSGKVLFFKNTGSATSPVYVQTTAGNPFPVGGVTPSNFYLYTTFADIDGDGDNDAILGGKNHGIIFYENTGTATAAVLTLQSGSSNPFNAFTDSWNVPAFADLNHDGKLDLVNSIYNQTDINYNSGTTTAPIFSNDHFVDLTRVTFADVDGDGDKDALFSSSADHIIYMRNDGPNTAPVFTDAIGTENPFDGIGSHFSNVLVDLDGDSDLDLVTGSNNSLDHYYENTGTATAPVYSELTGTSNPLDVFSYFTTANFVDLDHDGDMDFVGTGFNGATNDIYYFENTGSATSPSFTALTGISNPFDGLGSSSNNIYTSFVDIDVDGDMDLFLGTRDNGILYFMNTGTATSAAFTIQSGTSSPVNFINTSQPISGSLFGGDFMDVDADGDLDLFIGATITAGSGQVLFYENTSSIVTSVFNPTSNSFNGTVNAYPNPVKDVLSFSLNDGIGSNMQATVLNMNGQEFVKQAFENTGNPVSVDVSSLQAGIYMLKLNSSDKASVVKFVKQ